MKFKTFKIISSFILVLLIGCQSENDKPDIEKVISDLTINFPQLRKGKSKQIEYYKLIRSITYGEEEFKIQLRSEPDSLNDPQKILILINSKNECYAIPFFSNTYRDYWGFKHEKTIPEVIKTKTSFQAEFTSALKNLKLNDNRGTGNKVIIEMMFSLLNCKLITEKDSTDVLNGFLNKNQNLKNEFFNVSRERYKRNYKELSKDWHKSDCCPNYNSFYDTKNYRIYQFINEEDYYTKPLKLKIKCYRQNSILNTFSL